MGNRPTVDPSGSKSPTERLRDALSELVRQQASGSAGKAPTATALCELAGVSRNTLYRYHPDLLHKLHKIQRQHWRDPGPAKCTLSELRDENHALREQVTKLAALVDHYCAAWHESRTLLERRERELAELRRGSKPRLTSIQN